MAAPERAPERTDDEAILHRLGYAQVLYREMGGFSNFAISFTIISILAGCLTSYYLAFNNGGPVAITWGWLLVGAFCVLVAMAMGEIASSMPTAGALYFWASKLGGPAWGWFTGWFNLIGQIAVTASIQYGSALFLTALLNLWFPSLIGTDTGATFITLTVIVALQLGLNLMNVNVLALLNTVSAWWHMAGVVVIVGILILVPDNHQSAGFVFGEVINNSGFSSTGFVFALGLIMSLYTITGYDASAHMSEETRQASRASALGMVMAVVVSVVFGFILLVAVTFAVPDVQGTLDAAGNAVIYIWTESLGEVGAEFLLVIAVIAQLFCGTASVTSASRMMFAFSRDRAVPFSALWRKVAPNRVPVNAVTAISVLAWALMIPTLANGVVGYAVGTSIAVIGLYIAFAMPIILRIRAGDSFEPGAWSLGRHYKWVSPVAVGFIAVAAIICLMPLTPNGIFGAEEFSWEAVNYAPITVIGALILFGGWYFLSAHKWFTGPVREAGSEAELRSIEEQLTVEAGGGAATATVGAAAAATTEAAATATTTTDTATTDTEKADTEKAADTTEADSEDATSTTADSDTAASDDTAKDESATPETPAADSTSEDSAAEPTADAATDATEAPTADDTPADSTTADQATADQATADNTGVDATQEPAKTASDAPAAADTAEAEPTTAEQPTESTAADASDADSDGGTGTAVVAGTAAAAVGAADATPTADGNVDAANVDETTEADVDAATRAETDANTVPATIADPEPAAASTDTVAAAAEPAATTPEPVLATVPAAVATTPEPAPIPEPESVTAAQAKADIAQAKADAAQARAEAAEARADAAQARVEAAEARADAAQARADAALAAVPPVGPSANGKVDNRTDVS